MGLWTDLHVRQTIPPGYFAIPDVFEIIGRHHYSASGLWTGQEVEYEDLGTAFARPSAIYQGDSDVIKDLALYKRNKHRVLSVLGASEDPATPITNAQWIAATDKWRSWEASAHLVRERRAAVFWMMHRLGMSGDIGYCFINSIGQIRELDRSQWHCNFDVASDRFEHAALNGNPLYIMHRPDPWDEGRGYLDHFVRPIFVAEPNMPGVLLKIPSYSPNANEGNLAKARADRFIGQMSASRTPSPSGNSSHAAHDVSTKSPARRGRRPKWDWNKMMGELLRLADEDGLDDFNTQADLERWASAWFAARHDGDGPGESSIRERIAPVYAARDAHNARKAGN